MARPASLIPMLPASLAKAARRFQTWRSSRTTRQIPADLWGLAAEIGSRYGVSRTARVLGLSYYDLGKRVEALTTAEGAEAPPSFVEILSTQPSIRTECLVELTNVAGSTLRMHVNVGNTPDLAALWRVFLERQS